ncbi:MarR family winged helix-turn-helix transcriptional regulator [Cellulomonas sp. McL0617]|uniref:MarR family winged helix-turn-helix transcriptional regulator n=1 Tax=Cellulomonas sp. McL0617 TaxID=3415675 RepID=UPI003CE847EE
MLATTGFLLSKVGQAVTADYAERVAPLGLRPRHVGLLVAVDAAPEASQREIGETLGLVPSAIVPMVDDLERLGALHRVVDPANRRRHTLALTPEGRALLAQAVAHAAAQDDDVLAGLDAAQRQALHTALTGLLARGDRSAG